MGKGGGRKLPPWGQLGDISWHRDALDVSAERLTSPSTELGHGRNFSVVRQGLKYAKVGFFPLFGVEWHKSTRSHRGLSRWVPMGHLLPPMSPLTWCPSCTTSGPQPMAVSHSFFLGVEFLPVVCPEVTFVPRQTTPRAAQTYLSSEKTLSIGF